MKQTSKKVFYYLSLFCIFALNSCEKDLYDETLKKESNFKVEMVSFKNPKSESKIDANLFWTAEKFRYKKQNQTDRIVFDSINGFYFDDEQGIKVTKDDYESYTFKIIKENGDLENVVFSKNAQNQYDVYKVKYNFTEQEMGNLTEQAIENSPKEFLEIETNTNGQTTVSSKCAAYITAIISPRDDGIGPNTVYEYYLEGCGQTDVGNGGYSGGGSGTGGTGLGGYGGYGPGYGSANTGGNGAGSGGPNPGSGGNGVGGVITTPVGQNTLPADPCITLKKQLSPLSTGAKLKPAIVIYKTK